MTTVAAGKGELKLRQAIRRVHRPAWLSDRLRALEDQQSILRRNFNEIQLSEIRHGMNVPVDVLNAKELCLTELERVEQEMDVLMAGWDVFIQRKEGS